MSKILDERIVSMQFDNAQFERNVSTSLSTLDKLKKSLNFTGASKGLENVNSAASKCDLSPLRNAVETVGVKFSAMQVVATTALANITNSAVNAGKRIVKSLTIDPIKMGFQEYETQINAVQTILANTQSKGTTLDDVNRALDELNTYADKTIYNFTEMTRNIGTFTAAGVDLETATNAIQGIANLAAVSGSTSQQASTAMYQLSQALASGTVKLMDWNSVVNAGMGGQVFQDALKETARVHGVAIDDMIKKNGSFRETLREEWLTSEILTETLQKFTLTTEGLSEQQIEANRQMLKSKGYTEQQIEEIFKLGETATDAATKVKTFTQLMDTLKEAAQSGWTQSWELIVGDFEEAKELWTGVSDFFGGMIGRSAERRNNLLAGALDSNWDKMIDKIGEAGISVDDFEATVKETAKENGYPIDQMIKNWGDLETVIRKEVLPVKMLEEALANLSGSSVDLSKIIPGLKKGKTGDDVTQLQTALEELGFTLTKFGVDGIFGSETQGALKAFQEMAGLEITGIVDEATLKALEEATSKTLELDESLSDLVDGIEDPGGRELLIESFKNIGQAIFRPLQAIGSAWRETFSLKPEQLYNLIKGFKEFTDALVMSEDSAKKIGTAFKGLFSILEIGTTIIGGGFKWAIKGVQMILEHFDLNILDVAAAAGEAMTNFRDWLFENNRLTKGIKKVVGVMLDFGKAAWDWIGAFIKTEEVQEKIEAIKNAFSGTFKAIGNFFGGAWKKIKNFFKIFDVASGHLDTDMAKELLSNSFASIIDYFKNFDYSSISSAFSGVFSNIKSIIGEFFTKIAEKFGVTKETIEAFKTQLGTLFAPVGNFFSGKWTKIKEFFAQFKDVKSFKDIDFGAIFKNVKDSIVKWFQNFDLSNIGTSFQNIKNTIAAWFQDIDFGNIGSVFKRVFDNVKNVITVILDKIGIKFDDAKDSFEAFKDKVSDFFKIIREKIGDHAGSIAALGTLLGMVYMLMKIKNAVSLIAKPFAALTGIGEGIKDFIEGWKDGINITKKDTPTQAILNIAKSVALIAGSLWLISKIPKEDIWRAVGVMGAIAGGLLVMAVLTKLIDKIPTGSVKGKNGEGANFDGLAKMIAKIGIAMLLMAASVKILGSMNTEALTQGIVAIGVFLLAVIGLIFATEYANLSDADKFGKMIGKIATSLLILSLVIWIFGRMDTTTLIKGGAAVGIFLIGITAIMKRTDGISKDADKFGKMIRNIATSLLVLSLVVLIFGKMDTKTLIQGGLAVTAFIGIMLGAMKLSKSATADAANFGKMMLSLSVGLILMALAVKILGSMDTKTLVKGGIAVLGFVGIVALLMEATKLMDANSANAGKMGLMILSFSAAILLMAGAIAALSLIDGSDLAKAMAAITGIGLILAGLMYITKYAKDIKGIIGMAVAIAILSASLVALSFVDGDKLVKATIALGSIAAVMALLMYSCKSLEKIKTGKMLITLGAMVLVVGLLGYIIYKLCDNVKNTEGALEVALALSSLILALSGAAALLAIASKYGPKSTKGVGALLLMIGGVALIAGLVLGIAIWQLPNIAEQLSKFMVKLTPFLLGAKLIDSDLLNCLKILGEAMLLFTGAGSIFAVADIVTLGGVSRAFDEFIKFIKLVVPEIRDLAKEMDGEDINFKNLNAIVDAIKGLAEAASKIPNTTIAVFGSKWGGGGAISVANLSSFTKFIKEAVPKVKEVALAISGSNVAFNADRLTAIVNAIKGLAEAADAAPTVDISAALGKFKGGFGVGGTVSFTEFKRFGQFVSSSTSAIKTFMEGLSVTDADGNKVMKFGEEELAIVTPVCEAIKILAEAADSVPETTISAVAAGFGGKFASFIGGGGVVGGSTEYTDYVGFAGFVNRSFAAIKVFLSTIKRQDGTLTVTEDDLSIVTKVCEAIRIISEAADMVPSTIDAHITGGGGGLSLFAGAGGGGYLDADVTIKPMLDNIGLFITRTTTAIKTFIGSIQDQEGNVNISQKAVECVVGLSEAIKNIGAAAEHVPTQTDVDGWFAGGGGSLFGVAGFGGQVSATITPKLDDFKLWMIDVLDAMARFAESIAPVPLDQTDLDNVTALCDAVETIASAAQYAPVDTTIDTWIFDKVTTTNIQGLIDWVGGILPLITQFASGTLTTADGTTVTLEKVEPANIQKIISIAQAAKNMAQAASYAPTTEEMSAFWGAFTWNESTDINSTVEWFRNMYDMINGENGLLKLVSDNGVDMNALANLSEVAEVIRTISSSILSISTALDQGNALTDTNIMELVKMLETFQTFLDELNIDVEKVANAALAVERLSSVIVVLIDLGSKFNEKIDFDAFNTAITEITGGIDTFNTKMSEIGDVSSAVTQAKTLINMLGGLHTFNFSGASSFQTALETLGESSVDGFIKTFTDSTDKVKAAVEKMAKNASFKIRTQQIKSYFEAAGKYVVQGFASGISKNTYLAEAKAKAMAQKAYQAAKKQLDINSPSKVFMRLGTSVPEGFAKGVGMLGSSVKNAAVDMANTAIDGTKNAITRIAEAINTDVDTQPTIRPVLDLSDISSGAGAINNMLSTKPSIGLMSNVGTINTMMNNRQNGTNFDVISAIEDLGRKIGKTTGDTYQINGITYDDGSNINEAVKTLVRAARVERRI